MTAIHARIPGTIGALALIFSMVALSQSASAGLATPASGQASPRGHSIERACPVPKRTGIATCFALIRTDTLHQHVEPGNLPSGYGPADIQGAYSLTGGNAEGAVVAIVDAYDDPNAETDLGVYRAMYGLSPCTTGNGCFEKVNESGVQGSYPAANESWSTEISLDLDTVSAACPSCHILLVEANSNSISDLGTSVNTAVALGARYVSNSYGGFEYHGETALDSSYYHHPGVAITASSGDGGYAVEYPAASPYVTAVGGTSLTRADNARGWNETVWSDAGSGCSKFEPKPAFQNGADTGCVNRAVADVSAVADPATGVAVYDTYGYPGWAVYGGTSVSSPIIASVYALRGSPGGSTPAYYQYADPHGLWDVTSGSNGSCSTTQWCQARAGWDGPTGIGTPDGVSAFGDLSAPAGWGAGR